MDIGVTLRSVSIVWSLKRLFDPASYMWEEGELAAEREQAECTPDGEPPNYDTDASDTAAVVAVRYRCRVCQCEGESGPYCLGCLADTMEPLEG